jgi:hypothetical protein
MKLPYFEIEFKDYGRVVVASIGIGSALLEALAISNAEHQMPGDAGFRMSDIVSVRQLGDVHIPDPVEVADDIVPDLRSV